MMPKRPVPEIRDDLLRRIEPGVDREIVLDGAAPFFS